MKNFPLLLIVFAALAAACNKKKEDSGSGPAVTPGTGTRTELSLDSLYLYASQTYLWYDALPSYNDFAPRKFAASADGLAALKQELFALVQYKINPNTGVPYEYAVAMNQGKYSFVESGNVITGQQGSVSLEGAGNDLGLELSIVNGQDVYIRYVNTGSPAYKAGLTRGCRIVTVNDQPVVANAATLNSALAQSSLALKVVTPAGTTVSVNLNKESYTSSPVLKTAVLNNSGNITGYIAFARFSTLSTAQKDLDAAFVEFANAGVTNLVVDLRYNGGGYVQTAEYFADLIVPQSVNGAVMYAEYFNTLMQNGKATILKAIPYTDANKQPVYINGRQATYLDVDYSVKGNTHTYAKKGSLQTVKNVAFIVTGSTASASELLINSLKPHLNVQLVGSKTYGKPVGFFGIGIDKYTVYLSQFKSANSKGEGDYFDGFTPGIAAADDVTHDFGDSNELAIASALAWIKGGAIPSGGRLNINGREINAEQVQIQNSRENEFNGMIRTGGSMHLR